MIITLDRRSFCINMENDSNESLSPKDIVLIQDTDTIKEEDFDKLIHKFNDRLPLDESLFDENSLKSQRVRTKIIGAYVFDNFSVNGMHFDSDSNFLVFIRQTLSGDRPGEKKVRLLVQKSPRIDNKNINNKDVLDDLSKAIDKQGYIIEALNYIEEENRLDFIVNCYGLDAKTSEVFIDDKYRSRELKNYPPSIVEEWSDLEFSVNCLDLLEKYNIDYKYCLLKDNHYCNKRFNVNAIIKKSISESEKRNYSEEKTYFDDDYYHVLSKWDNSRELFWNWILNQNEVSDDIIEIPVDMSYLKLPIDYEEVVHNIDTTLEIRFKIESDNKEFNVKEDEESSVTIFEKSKGVFEKNFKKYLLNQELKINKEVFLTDSFLNKLMSFNSFKILTIKEQSIILIKSNCIVNENKEQELLEKIRG